jgi:alpha-glucosidase
VKEEMKKVFRFWMAKGVSGFRIDAINHLMEYEHLWDEPRNLDVSDEDSYSYVYHDYTLDLLETYDVVYEFRQVMEEWTAKYQTETK